jgi:hypothetical protein
VSRAHWCRHYGYADGPTCAVGLDLSEPGKSARCMPRPHGPRCPSREDLSDEEIKAHEDRARQAAVDALMVVAAIPTEGREGSLACPACQTGTVLWSRAEGGARARSLSLRATCSTPGCVRFMS